MINKWEKENGLYEAGFDHNGSEMSAMFEANGTITESEMEIKVSELPASVIQYITAHHKGATEKATAKNTKANGDVNYEAEVKDKDLIFDATGKFLKEVKGYFFYSYRLRVNSKGGYIYTSLFLYTCKIQFLFSFHKYVYILKLILCPHLRC